MLAREYGSSIRIMKPYRDVCIDKLISEDYIGFRGRGEGSREQWGVKNWKNQKFRVIY